MFARTNVTLDAIHAELASGAIQELPSARGCAYFLPRADLGLGLAVGRRFANVPLRTAEKYLGVTSRELDALQRAILDALSDGPLDPRGLRDRLGDTVRNLGEEGKKRGQTTTLPLALGLLQAEGQIRRQPLDQRLDQERYAYTLWLDAPPRPAEDEAWRTLATRFFDWTGPARVREWQAFAGISVKEAKDAVESLDLVEVEADGLCLPRALADLYRDFVTPTEPNYRLVAGLDTLLLARRDVLSHVPAQHRATIDRVGLGRGLQDIEHHAILDRGQLVGLWEFDPETETIVSLSFVPADDAMRAEIDRTEAFIRAVGDARLASLDGVKSRQPRLLRLRALAES